MPSIDKSLLKQLNQQIANELGASHTYLQMSAYFEDEDLEGMAAWMRSQSEEEREHAMKFYDHINHRGDLVELQSIAKPPTKYKGVTDVFQHALEHEREVTQQIYQLYKAAQEKQDYALQVFLNWFVTEQVEEENTFETLVAKAKRIEKDGAGLLLLDKELADRASAGGH